VITVLLSMGTLVVGLVLGAVAASVWSHRAIRLQEPFACKLRRERPIARHGRRRWSRRNARAAWVHDVLLVQRGRLMGRTSVLAVREVGSTLRETGTDEVAGLGPRPLVLTVWPDDGPPLDLAAAGTDRASLVGPFLAAAIPGLPEGRKERRNLGR
jgi:hypothetical protein